MRSICRLCSQYSTQFILRPTRSFRSQSHRRVRAALIEGIGDTRSCPVVRVTIMPSAGCVTDWLRTNLIQALTILSLAVQ
jgi:hypothetical protein